MPRLRPHLIVLALLAACDVSSGGEAEEGASASSSGGAPECRVESRAVALAAGVRESSGAAASRRHEGIIWTHGDSGGGAEVHAVRADGTLAGTVRVAGAENHDWEDVALGPCPGGGDCLYLADVGDNDLDRESLSLWRVPEPAPGDSATPRAERVEARYPAGRRDAEALFVLSGGEIYLVSKGGKTHPVELFRFPSRSGGAMERVRQVAPAPEQPGDRVTGASASADGRWVALRTYTSLHLFRTEELLREGGGPALTSDLAGLGEAQGEGVALAPGGTVFLLGEGAGRGARGTLARLRCTLP